MNDRGSDKYGTPPMEEDFAVAKDWLNPTLPTESDEYTEAELRSTEEWFRLASEADPTPSLTESEFAREWTMAEQ